MKKELAERYSDACTRAALAALITSAAAFSFYQVLKTIAPLNALGAYVVQRHMLNSSLEEVTNSPFWEAMVRAVGKDHSSDLQLTLKEIQSLQCRESSRFGKVAEVVSSRDADKASLAQSSNGLALRIDPPDTAAPPAVAGVDSDESQQGEPKAGERGANKHSVPAPPSDLSIVSECPGVAELEYAAHTLWDDKIINTARESSNVANVTLYRWQLARDRIGGIEYKSDGSAEPAMVTLEAFEHLDTHPIISLTDFDKEARERTSVTGLYSTGGQSVVFASLIAEMILLLFVAYYFLNFRVARAKKVLRVPGTMFSTFMEDRVGRVCYGVLLAVPSIASTLLASGMSGLKAFMAAGCAFLITAITANLYLTFIRSLKNLDQMDQS